MAENDCMRGRVGDTIGQGGLEEVRVGLTCVRIRQRREGSLGPTAAVAQGAGHFPLQDGCVSAGRHTARRWLWHIGTTSWKCLCKIKLSRVINTEKPKPDFGISVAIVL